MNIKSLNVFCSQDVREVILDDREMERRLFLSAQMGRTNEVYELLQSGVNPNIPDQHGWTPLMIALKNGHEEIVTALLTSPCLDVTLKNEDGYCALFVAVEHNRVESLRQLLEKDLFVDTREASGYTALWLAFLAGHMDCCHVLMQASADINAKNADGRTLLMYVACGFESYGGEHIHSLIQLGADVHAVDVAGRTALSYAVITGSKECVDILIRAGANIHVKDNDGQILFILAICRGRPDIIQTLVDHGIECNLIDGNGCLPIHNAKYVMTNRRYKEVREAIFSKMGSESLEYFRFYNKTKKVAHLFSLAGISTYFIDGNSVCFERGGIPGNGQDCYFSKVMMKHVRSFVRDHPHIFSEKLSTLLEKVLENTKIMKEQMSRNIVDHYFQDKSCLISIGCQEHVAYMLLCGSRVLLIDRGVCCGDRTVECCTLSSSLLEDRERLIEFIQDICNLSRRSFEDYVRFRQAFGDNPLFYEVGKVDRRYSFLLALDRQIADNCSWANLEGAVFALAGLQAIDQMLPVSDELLDDERKALWQETMKSVHTAFGTFIRYMRQRVFDEYLQKVPEGRQELDIVEQAQALLSIKL